LPPGSCHVCCPFEIKSFKNIQIKFYPGYLLLEWAGKGRGGTRPKKAEFSLDSPVPPVDNARHFSGPGGRFRNTFVTDKPMLKLCRRFIGVVVNFLDLLTRPQPIQRSEPELKRLAQEVKRLRVYDYRGCPSSLKLRQALYRLNVDIQYCDIRKCQIYQDDLLSQFGRLHAPCLRIEQNQNVQWLDDPAEIIQYLNQRFDPATPQDALA